MTRAPIDVVLVALVLAAVAAAASGAAFRSAPHTVSCNEIIGGTSWPSLGSPDYRYRLVLGAVSVPPAYVPQVVHLRDGAWPYWEKAGLVVRAGRGPVTVSVPPAWRTRGAITWGGNTGAVDSLRIARCGSDPSRGNAYAGGFYLRSRSARLPLVFRVGGHATTVRFRLGRRCR